MQHLTPSGFTVLARGARPRRGRRIAALGASVLATCAVAFTVPGRAWAGGYTAELASGASTVSIAGDMVAAGNLLAIGGTNGGYGTPQNSITWPAPAGETFAGFRYTSANFHGTAASGKYTGGFAGGFVATGADGSVLEFPWTNDCQVISANHYWTHGGLAENGATCATTGNSSGWNYDNSEVDSTTGQSMAENYRSLSLNVDCKAKVCVSGATAEATAANLSVLVDDPDDLVTVSGVGWLGGTVASEGFYQTESSSPTLQFNAADPGGVCYSDVSYTSTDGGGSGGSGDLSPVPTTVTPSAGIGREFASITPCGINVSEQFTLPASLASGTYQLAIQTENAGSYEGAGFSGAGVASTNAGQINVDNTIPSVSIADPTNAAAATVTVTTGPSGLSSLTCSDDGVTVSPTWVSGTMIGQHSTTGGTLSSSWSVPTGASVNDVNCVASNGDLNGALSNPVATFSDPEYVPGTWTTATPSDPQVVTVTPSAGATLGRCELDGNPPPTQMSANNEIDVTGSGVHTITCQVSAAATATSISESSYQILVDDQSPTVAFTGQTAVDAADGTWVSGTPTVSMVGEELDASGQNHLLSGVVAITCTVNGADPQTLTPTTASGYAASFRLTENGVDTVTCTPTSGAGVVGQPVSEVVKVDNPAVVADGGALTSYGSSVLIDDGSDPYSGGPAQHTWYHAEQQVTITATNTGGGAPISSVACTGATLAGGESAGRWPNNSGGDTEQINVEVQSPGGDLVCSATDSAGNSYPLGGYDFQIDDTPPTGAFVAQGAWPAPDELELAVTDPDGTLASGVASVRVYAQPTSGGLPDDLGLARYDAATGDYCVTVDDGVMTSGSYSFYANVSDVAGNQSQVTAGPAGEVETLTLPLRSPVSISTNSGAISGIQAPAIPLDVADSAGLASAATNPAVIDANLAQLAARQATRPEPAAIRAHIRPAKTSQLKIGSIRLRFGQAIVLRGRLRHDGQVLADRSLTVWRVLSGAGTATRVATAKTDSSGRYRVRVKAGPSGMLYVVYAGSSRLRAVAAELKVNVSGRVRIEMGAMIAGRTAVLRGRIYGGHIPAGGINIALKYSIVGYTGWGTFETAHAGRDGRFAISFPVGVRDEGLTYRLRVEVLPSGGWPYDGGVSNVLTRKVS